MEIKKIYRSAWDIGGNYVLKRGDDLAVLEKSIRLSGLLTAQGVPVPEYVGKPVQADGAYCVLMKKINGSHLDPYKGNPYENGVMLGRLIAELHAALREIPDNFDCPEGDYMRGLDEYIMEEFRAKSVRVPKNVLAYCHAFGPLYEKLPRQLIHRDVHTSNMLFEDGAFTGWLDFDNAERNARVHDLCYLGATMLVGNYRKRRRLRTWKVIFRSVLRGYDKTSPLIHDEREAVPYMFVHIELLFAAFFSKNGQGKIARSCIGMARWLYRRRAMLAEIACVNETAMRKLT